jgi:nitric oxide reductase large subunit
VILVMVFGSTLLTVVTVKTYKGAPPIPAQVVSPSGQLLLTVDDVNKGQDATRVGRASARVRGKDAAGRWRRDPWMSNALR